MINSSLAASIGLIIAILLIIRKMAPVYALILGAVIGGLLSGWGIQDTCSRMISGVKDITPAILRILSAGILTGMLIKTKAAERIALSIISSLGHGFVYLAVAISTMLLTLTGVFIDVAVITVAPIAAMAGAKAGLDRNRMLFALIGGGKCGNIMSPNPNTIIAAENFEAPLSSVMVANIIPAIISLAITVFIIIRLIPARSPMQSSPEESGGQDELPSLWSSLAGPLTAIALLALRPIAGISIDPMIALPTGGLIGIAATGRWKDGSTCLRYGLDKMAPIAILLVGTGTIAGIIKASDIKDLLVNVISRWNVDGTFIATLSGALMSAATASTTAGATIASASFADVITAAGISSVWGAALVNSGATILDHLPHGSFFHATGGSLGMNVKERLKLIPYETITGFVLALSGIIWCMIGA